MDACYLTASGFKADPVAYTVRDGMDNTARQVVHQFRNLSTLTLAWALCMCRISGGGLFARKIGPPGNRRPADLRTYAIFPDRSALYISPAGTMSLWDDDLGSEALEQDDRAYERVFGLVA